MLNEKGFLIFSAMLVSIVSVGIFSTAPLLGMGVLLVFGEGIIGALDS